MVRDGDRFDDGKSARGAVPRWRRAQGIIGAALGVVPILLILSLGNYALIFTFVHYLPLILLALVAALFFMVGRRLRHRRVLSGWFMMTSGGLGLAYVALFALMRWGSPNSEGLYATLFHLFWLLFFYLSCFVSFSSCM